MENYKTPSYQRKSAKNYYDKIKDTKECKLKSHLRYVERKKKQYIAQHGSIDGFIKPNQKN